MHPGNGLDSESPFGLGYRRARQAVPAILSLVLLVACGSSPDGSSPPAVPWTTPVPSGPHTVRGEVFSFATGVIGDASIDIWVRTPFVSYSYWWANGPLRSDGIGHFEAGNLPRSEIRIRAIQAGYLQPCAVDVEVGSDLSIRVELIPASTLEAFNPPRPQLSTEPSVSGVIYETTASGREPVAGASLGVEVEIDMETTMTAATTLSDRGGGFFLCNLGEEAYIQVTKPGFEEKWVGPIDSSTESRMLEIELKRL